MESIMNRRLISLTALAALAFAACRDGSETTAPGASPDASNARPPQNPTGGVYVQTNSAAGNEVVAYRRAANGTLSRVGTFSTGGRGTGTPLSSQGPVILSDDGRWLLVANVGSDEVSVFAVRPSGLALTDKVASGGDMPFSLTLRGSLLYVLNRGGAGNITAFTLSPTGELSPLANSTRPLSGSATGSPTLPDPAQVSFSPDGATLVVTEKATNLLDTYAVNPTTGLATGPNVFSSSGQLPFGFAFKPNTSIFVVTEAFGGELGQAAASSYTIGSGSALRLISGAVRDTHAEVCWAVITNDGRYAYVTNFRTGNLSSYAVAADGGLTLLQAIAGTTTPPGADPRFGPKDEDLSRDGRYLYVLDIGLTDPAVRGVHAFRVEPDGKLTKLGAFPLPGSFPAVAGLAAD